MLESAGLEFIQIFSQDRKQKRGDVEEIGEDEEKRHLEKGILSNLSKFCEYNRYETKSKETKFGKNHGTKVEEKEKDMDFENFENLFCEYKELNFK